MPSSIQRRRSASSPMAETAKSRKPITRNQKSRKQLNDKVEKQPLIGGLRSFFSCKYYSTVVEGEKKKKKKKKKVKKVGWSGSLCNLRESSRVMQKPEPYGCSASNINRFSKCPKDETNAISSSSSSSNLMALRTPSSSSSSSLAGSFRGVNLKKISGCYECSMVIDPAAGVSRVPSLRRTNNIFPCSQCGEVFSKSESLEFHQAVKHAVSELGHEDNSRNIVEIIFKSSWLKIPYPACKIDRVLKINHTPRTVTRFINYRDSIKIKASRLAKKHPRCIADGNELLRFHCTSFTCPLGLHGTTNLCLSLQSCHLCSIIRDGFKLDEFGRIPTMATSGRAHDTAQIMLDGQERAMLVCRVIAGRVKMDLDGSEEFDSVDGSEGVRGNLEELYVFDTRAVLPCFVVIYTSF